MAISRQRPTTFTFKDVCVNDCMTLAAEVLLVKQDGGTLGTFRNILTARLFGDIFQTELCKITPVYPTLRTLPFSAWFNSITKPMAKALFPDRCSNSNYHSIRLRH